MNKYEIENILQTKPKMSAREYFLQGRWTIFRAGKSSRSPALQGRWFQMLTSSPDFIMFMCYLTVSAPIHCLHVLVDNSGGNNTKGSNDDVGSHERLSGKILLTFISLYFYFITLTLTLLVAYLAITKLCKKPEK